MMGRVAAVALVALCFAEQTAADSLYTSIQRSDCRPPSPSVAQPFTDKDLGVQECPAPDGWRLLFVASQANSWLEVHGPGVRWSGERDVVYESPIGLSPNVGGDACRMAVRPRSPPARDHLSRRRAGSQRSYSTCLTPVRCAARTGRAVPDRARRLERGRARAGRQTVRLSVVRAA